VILLRLPSQNDSAFSTSKSPFRRSCRRDRSQRPASFPSVAAPTSNFPPSFSDRSSESSIFLFWVWCGSPGPSQFHVPSSCPTPYLLLLLFWFLVFFFSFIFFCAGLSALRGSLLCSSFHLPVRVPLFFFPFCVSLQEVCPRLTAKIKFLFALQESPRVTSVLYPLFETIR